MDPEDAALACRAVNALPCHGGGRARVSPDGYVAQRFDRDMVGDKRWVLTHLGSGGLSIQVLSDDEVADWPRLTYAPDGEAP